MKTLASFGNIVRCLAGLLMLISLRSISACEVPVFRYALERWNPDPYRLLVLSEGPLTEEQQKILEATESVSGLSSAPEVRIHDVAKTRDSFVSAVWKRYRQGSAPLVVALYPERSSVEADQVAFAGPLTAETLQIVLESPARTEIRKKLTEGQSAVWIFVESGIVEKDDIARKTLETQLRKDAEWLKLPSPEEMEIRPEQLAEMKIRLQIDFALVSVRRDDPREKFLVESLLNSESDLGEFNEPFAFPVFGRGRVLYALVGQGIAPETIRTASAFMAGPCSCQVKEQNPGFDLLMPCDWEELVGTVLISEPIPEENAEPRLLTIPPGRSRLQR